MRKFIVLTAAVTALAGAGVALAGQAATNASGEYIDLNVSVSPPLTGTASAPRGVGVSFDSFTGNRINGNIPGLDNAITVRFNKGFKANNLMFPSCKISPTALTKCASATQVGTGSAEAELPGSGSAAPTFIPAKLIAYNGKPLSGKAPTMIFIASINGKPSAELDFTVTQQPTGPYGLAFVEIHLPSATPSSFSLAKFSVQIPDRTVTVKRHGKTTKVHLIEAPTTCQGAWKFAQINTFKAAPPLIATDSQTCAKG
jgi:hypothetical protein